MVSGDATRSDNLIRHAKGADSLVHEVVSHEGVQALVQTFDPGNRELVQRIVDAHTPTDQVGAVATAAGVKKPVLTHFVPTGLHAYDNVDAWTKGVRKTYAGELVVGQDLLEVR
ncbi:MAG: MBL fold metallo-hydrolase [Cupriavidus necator]